jgi:hypothetical protein
MKRTCYGCKALEGDHCYLGYKNEKLFKNYSSTDVKPLEECPKPKTNDKYMEYLRRSKRK